MVACAPARGGNLTSSEQQRQVTVVFCDLVGSTEELSLVGPERFHEILREYHRDCGTVIDRYGGYIAQPLGDGVLVYFGYPTTHEDAGRRAVSAALELIETVERLGKRHNRPLRARVGVDTGIVFIGQVGAKQGNNLAVGEAVPRAARLQTLASPNRVVVSESTHQLARNDFEWRTLGTVELKGLAGLTAIYEVVRARGARERLEAAASGAQIGFVEQGSQLPALLELWAAAARGQGQIVTLTGEPGLGKSRHAMALAERARNASGWVIHAATSSQYQSSPLHPLLDAIRYDLDLPSLRTPEQKLAALRDSLSESDRTSDTLPLLAAALSLSPSAGFTPVAYLPQRLHAATVRAVMSWFVGRARRGTTLLVLEDLHWSDPSTVEVLSALGESVSGFPLMVLVTSRPGWESHRDTKAIAGVSGLIRLNLDRMSREASLAIVNGVTGGRSLPPALLSQVLERAGDTPLFVEEMTRALLISGNLRLVADRYELDGSEAALKVPASLQDALAARLDLLGASKSLVQLAAAIGLEVQLDVLCASADQDEATILRDLELAERAGLLHRAQGHLANTFVFKHGLIQQQAYEDLPSATRRTYHRQIARAIVSLHGSDDVPELLGHHYARGDEPSLAAAAYAQAGARSIGRSAYFEAAKAYAAAIEQLLRVPESAERDAQELELVALLGFTLLSTRGFSDVEVEKAYRRAFDLCNRLGSKAPLRVLYGVWAYNLTHGGVADSLDISRTFEAVLGQSSELLDELTVRAVLGVSAFSRGDFRAVHRYLEPAVALVDLDQVSTQHFQLLQRNGFDAVLNTFLFLAWTQLIEGNAAACRANISKALAAAEKSGHPYIIATSLSVTGSIAHHLRDPAIAQDYGQRLMGLAQENHFLYWMGGALCMLGWASCAANQVQIGLPVIEQGIALFQAMGDAYVVPYFLSYLVEAHLQEKRFAAAAETVERVLALSEGRGTRAFVAEFERLKGEALLGLGEPGAAEDHFRLACAISRVQGAHLFGLRAALSLARVLHEQGRHQEAADQLRPALLALTSPSGVSEAASAEELLRSLPGAARA